MAFESDQSAFNMGIAYLERINKILYMCQSAAAQNNLDLWLTHLRGLYRELAVKLQEKEEDDVLADFKNINLLINDPVKKNSEKNFILYSLDKLEVKLRRYAQKKGMLLPSKDDPRFAVLQR